LASQLLRCSGCRVFGVDVSPAALNLAIQTGSVDDGALSGQDSVESMIDDFSRGRGIDVVLICAATASDEPVHIAGRIARKRARVVVVGAVGMNVPRENYYEKEINFSVSCSYGPGRYDPSYEFDGLDYPFGLVRWTEGRNLEAFLDMVRVGKLTPLALVTHRFAFADAPQAYDMVAEKSEPYAGILLEYPAAPPPQLSVVNLQPPAKPSHGILGIGCIGAGSYAQSFLLPPLRKHKAVRFTGIFTRSGLSAVDAGRRFGFERAFDSAQAVMEADDTHAVVIATRHDQHGSLVLQAMAQGKHVFVEKPLCIARAELEDIAKSASNLTETNRLPVIQTGFNRRFSPSVRHIREHFGRDPGPLVMLYRVNAGAIPREHWVQDPIAGGGRIVGEVCHFIDTMQSLANSDPISVSAKCIVTAGEAQMPEDSVLITLTFSDGSVGTIAYCARGASSLPKEYLEVHAARRSAVLENFASVSLFGPRGRKRVRCPGKGQAEEIAAFVQAVRDGEAAIPLASQLCTTLAALCTLESLRTGATVAIDLESLSWKSNRG
jgi:predicted dehydrogenase